MANNAKSCLIIRSQTGADATAAKVANLGYCPIILPAAILCPTNNIININNIQAILITSSNAPRLAKLNDDILKIPVFAVGDATKQAAIEAGFENVISAGGDASALAVLTADRLKPNNGALMHLRGLEVAGDVKGLLNACGFEVKTTTIYETIENPEFVLNINNILKENSGIVLFHSPKGAQRFRKYADFSLLSHWTAICISSATMVSIDEPAWKQIHAAISPNEASMMEQINKLPN